MSLYQKYRPDDFNSLIWQEFINECLKNALKNNKTVGAYLFIWSRWVGKTSTARILAKWFNCLDLKDWNPCLECENCRLAEEWKMLDLIEIDAASNTWVDNIRDLIEKAQFQPNIGKFKIYIIDEVHMLSKWAFNALLKTLEEPPIHVKFILATTEIDKVPETIISRTQRYDFKRISIWDLVSRLEFVANSENIKFEKEALEFIAKLAKWWLRDALSLFEQFSSSGEITVSIIQKNLWLVWTEFINEFINLLIQKDKDWIITKIEKLKENTVDIKTFFEEIIFALREKIEENINTPNFPIYFNIFENFEEWYRKLKFTPDPFILFEFIVFKLINTWAPIIIENNPEKKGITKKSEIKKEEKLEDIVFDIFDEEPKKEIIQDFNTNTEWFDYKKLIEEIKKIKWKAFVGMSLNSSKHNLEWNKLIITAPTNFHKEKLEDPEISALIWQKINDLFWIELEIVIK